MNESEKAAPSTTAEAAKAVLARRSNQQIPLSLGKASLRMRLEAYYSLIAPDTLTDRTEWLNRYDQIYEKYGGTHQGEAKLATKLAKKYGTAVRLLLAKSAQASRKSTTATDRESKKDESWYALRRQEAGSGLMDASSPNFDPLAMLLAPTERVYSANPWMAVSSTSILDNLGKCATLLPQDDPLFRESHHKQQQLRKAVALAPSIVQAKTAPQAASSSSDNNTKDTKKRLRTSNPHPFEAIAAQLDAGPHSLLVRLREERKRVTVVVRYVNMVRGNLTGTLLAFDKHLNMILRDVEEVYSPRLVDEEHSLSNLDLELERRRRVEAAAQAPAESPFAPQPSSQPEPGTWNVRRRQMKQLMVRGDMVVSVYEANEENRNITRSRYRKRSATGNAKVDENNNTAKRQKSDKNT